jgi:hypothetical protein
LQNFGNQNDSKRYFEVVLDYFEEHGDEWKNLYAISTERAPVMLGCKPEFHTLIKIV